MLRIRKILVIFGVAAMTGAVAEARGPGIYSHTIARSHSQPECLRRAGAVADKHGFIVEGDDRGIWMTSTNGTMGYSIRCDIPNITLIITSGPEAQLRQQAEQIVADYSAVNLGG